MIRNIFNPGNYPNNIHFVLLLLRLAAGALMLTHGMGKFATLIGGEPIQFPDPIGVGATASLVLAVFAEMFCAIFLIFGVGTRLAAIPLLITMSVAVLIIHTNDPIGIRELPLLYASIFLVLAIAGAGKFSIDNWIYKGLKRR